MPMLPAKWMTSAAAMLAALVLAGCASERGAFPDPFAPAPPPAAPPRPAAPPVNMTGRWLLASPNGGMCGMNFTTAQGGNRGRIAPEGGCPGNFFTSRSWGFDQGALVIYDHKEQPLARLPASDPPGRFEGTAASGIPVNLSR